MLSIIFKCLQKNNSQFFFIKEHLDENKKLKIQISKNEKKVIIVIIEG